jgi:hypothetical protein
MEKKLIALHDILILCAFCFSSFAGNNQEHSRILHLHIREVVAGGWWWWWWEWEWEWEWQQE